MYIAGDLLIFIGKNSAVCLLTGLVITGLGIYGIFGITFAMQPDVIDYSEYQKNSSIAGGSSRQKSLGSLIRTEAFHFIKEKA